VSCHSVCDVVCVEVGLFDLEVNTLSKILCVMVIIMSLVMMIIKVRHFSHAVQSHS